MATEAAAIIAAIQPLEPASVHTFLPDVVAERIAEKTSWVSHTWQSLFPMNLN